jgi:hypothetical protein
MCLLQPHTLVVARSTEYPFYHNVSILTHIRYQKSKKPRPSLPASSHFSRMDQRTLYGSQMDQEHGYASIRRIPLYCLVATKQGEKPTAGHVMVPTRGKELG